MSDPLSMSLDDATHVWSLVEKQLDAFYQAWEGAAEPPHIKDFLGDHETAIRRLILIDLVKVDIEFRTPNPSWIQPIEFYLNAWPELSPNDNVPPELLYEEIYQRRDQGLEPNLEDYKQRFPQAATALQRLLGTNQDILASTGISQGTRNITEYQVGDVVDDFELRVELGRGAFGVVFLAIQKSMQRMVALKISANRGTEAQVLAQLEHPNIVRVYDRRVLQDNDVQLFYMQYVRGGTLQDAMRYVQARDPAEWSGKLILEGIDKVLDDHGEVIPAPTPARLSLAKSDWIKATCDMGIQLASALDYSHQKNTLHRDIKPANILLTVDGVAKLADFNISCNSKVDGASPAAYFGGSLAYMSPEQLEAYSPHHEREPDSLDGRSDIYSAAVVVWEMLTGERPFRDERFQETWETTLEQMTAKRKAGLTETEWSHLPNGCPRALRAFFEKALQPSPDKRFTQAADMIRLLRIAGSEVRGESAVSSQTSISNFSRQHPFVVLFLASVIPNALAAAFVSFYNNVQAIKDGAEGERLFNFAVILINGVFFPLGAYVVIRFAWPMVKAFRARQRGEVLSKADQIVARNRSLNLGRLVFLIGMSLWVFASVLYPFVLRNELNSTGDMFHFFVSHILGGLLAGTYPFFVLTYVGVSAWYPPFLEIGVDDDGTEAALLATTQKTSSWAEAIVAALPLFSIVVLVFVTGRETGAESDRDSHQRMLAILSVGSLVGYGVLYWLSRGIRTRIERLRSILNPDDSTTRI